MERILMTGCRVVMRRNGVRYLAGQRLGDIGLPYVIISMPFRHCYSDPIKLFLKSILSYCSDRNRCKFGYTGFNCNLSGDSGFQKIFESKFDLIKLHFIIHYI